MCVVSKLYCVCAFCAVLFPAVLFRLCILMLFFVLCLIVCHHVVSSSQGVVNLVVECLDRLHLYTSASNFAESVGGGGGAGEGWESLLNSFYQLLGQSAAVETTHFYPV